MDRTLERSGGDLLVEICCGSLEAALTAASLGARRIELCADLPVGGVTPAREDILECVRSLDSVLPVQDRISSPRKGTAGCSGDSGKGSSVADSQEKIIRRRTRIHVLVRPRPGDFIYSSEEVLAMLDDIAFCAKAGVDGVVVGALTKDGIVDTEVSGRLISFARSQGLSVTFHRAIDESADPLQAVRDIITLGADRILTSGGAPSAPEGISMICSMIRESAGRIVIMPGAGLTATTAPPVIAALQTTLANTQESGAPQSGFSDPPASTALTIEIHGSSLSLLDL